MTGVELFEGQRARMFGIACTEILEINGQPAVVIRWQAVTAVLAPEVDGERVAAVRLIINPDKLGAVTNRRPAESERHD